MLYFQSTTTIDGRQRTMLSQNVEDIMFCFVFRLLLKLNEAN